MLTGNCSKPFIERLYKSTELFPHLASMTNRVFMAWCVAKTWTG